ncbi:glycoside hydrolase domain-containing protein [Streptomyces sp. NBC_00459]|uniref:glycoside hydrolase domain-containing protein n=1 Tax=Streptomyces sp. NBC_00459 TaxID=2975749 RepID=UPI002E1873F3
MDDMVLQAQKFINTTYAGVPGIPTVVEDGTTGWDVMYALTRALQYELGITALSDTFGPTTLGKLTTLYPVIDGTNTNANINRIVQSGLYCKGYDGSGISGSYDSTTGSSVTQLKANMGVAATFPGNGVTPKVFKALLTMDPYVLISGGSDQVRAIQQWMNASYINRANFFIIPCDGYFSRDVQKALMFAIQFAIGYDDATANGVFGPGTQAGLKANTLSVGSSGTFVQLFTAAMVFNKRSGAVFSSSFGSDLADAVSNFQSFVRLPVTGTGNFQTWASLLVSTGDPSRSGTACDCVTEVTADRAAALKASGYSIIGRYLTNVAGTTLNKKIQAGELDTIAGAGLRVFPIYQTYGGSVSYFNHSQGVADASAAIDAAQGYGFKRGTRIYFAVDYDALDADVTSNIIPHFQGIQDRFDQYAAGYKIGVYGPRNICSRVAASGATSASFVSDMSTGFSGNLGFSMPEDWAFDQISTISIGSGTGAIQIDNDISSDRDSGQNTFDPVPTQKLDVAFDTANRDALLADIRATMQSLGVDETTWYTNHSTEDALNVVLQYDSYITGLARSLKMRKSLIQVPIFWEYRKYTYLDDAANTFVQEYYSYMEQMEAWNNMPVWQQLITPVPEMPVGSREDASAGLGQIFAATAISARNYCSSVGITDEATLDASDWHTMETVWNNLYTDNEYNITTAALVHISDAHSIGQRVPGLDYTDAETQAVLARYNGTGDDATEYGVQNLSVYQTFEKYNAPARNL